VRIASRGVATERRGSKVHLDVAAGEDWDALVGTCVDEGFSGVESLAGIRASSVQHPSRTSVRTVTK